MMKKMFLSIFLAVMAGWIAPAQAQEGEQQVPPPPPPQTQAAPGGEQPDVAPPQDAPRQEEAPRPTDPQQNPQFDQSRRFDSRQDDSQQAAQPPYAPPQERSAGYSQPSSAPLDAAPSEVGHISLIHGNVSMLRGDSGDWVATTLNSPLVRGDQVATGDSSRTEVQLDFANVLRLSARAQAKIADLTRSHIQVQVAQGYADYSIFKGNEAEVEIDTPNVAVHPTRFGVYRVQVNSDAETDVIVREGEAQVSTAQGGITVHQGELIAIRGTDNPEYKVEEAPFSDDWDRWNKDRDNTILSAEAVRKTSPYYTGVQDLDAYGHWTSIPDYGPVWAPYQTAAWAPYRDGRWVWEPYYGWTWVSYEPWGWAPYHYGRWFFTAGSWYWWPGPVYPAYRPIYAPAYVSFFGFGRGVGFNVGFGFGFGSIGWLPIGPADRFYPWYGRGFNRVNVVNVTNINVFNRGGGFVAPLAVRGTRFSNVDLAFTNERVRSSISAVEANSFGRGLGVRREVSAAEFREGRVMTGNLPVVPTRESLQPARAGVRPSVVGARSGAAEHFFTRNRPPAGPPAFHEQAAQVRQAVEGRESNSMARMQGGDRPFGNPNNGSRITGSDRPPSAQRPASGGGNGSGWRSFSGSQGPSSRGASGSSGSPAFGGGVNNRGGSDPSERQGFPRQGSSRQGSPNQGNGWNRFSGPGASRGAGPASGSDRPPSSFHGSERGMGPAVGGQRFPGSSSEPRFSNGGFSRGGGSNGGFSNGGFSRGAESRGESMGGRSSGFKPPLELNKPIVTPRESGPRGGSGGGFGGGGRRESAPSFSHGGGGGGRSGGSHSGGGGHPRH